MSSHKVVNLIHIMTIYSHCGPQLIGCLAKNYFYLFQSKWVFDAWTMNEDPHSVASQRISLWLSVFSSSAPKVSLPSNYLHGLHSPGNFEPKS